MKSIIIITIILILSIGCIVNAGRHSAADIFNGSFYFVNASAMVNGQQVATRDPSLGQLIGNIMYAPAYPGALYGNMTVAYGNDLASNVNQSIALSMFSAYTGPYEVFPDATPYPYVVHHPIITNNPINGKTVKNVPATRYYNMFEDDNLLQINSLMPPQTSYLYWRRNFPFPAAPACTVSASISASGSGWLSGGVWFQQYTLTVTNVGQSQVLSTQVAINLAPSQSISSSWNIAFVSGNVYNVPIYSPLAIGESTTAGFILAGTGVASVGVPTSGSSCV